MMRTKVVVLALFAALCMSAVAVATASANEGRFVKKGTEEALKKTKFTGVNSGNTILETVGGNKVECKKLSATGEIKGTEEGVQKIKFKECTSTFGVGCEGGETGHGTNEIWTNADSHTRQNVGRTAGFLLVTLEIELPFTCFGIPIVARASFLTSTIALNSAKKTFAFAAKQTKGKQENQKEELENKETKTVHLETSVNGGAFEESGQGGTEEITFEEEGELIS